MSIAEAIAVIARLAPERPAITAGERSITYAGFVRRAAALARAMTGRLGLQPGDRVAMFMENHLEFYPVLLACWRAGLVAVPINSKLHPKELEWILGDSGAKLLFVSGKQASTAASTRVRTVCVDDADYGSFTSGDVAAAVDARASDPAWLFYTSGTTGRPKGAILSHRSLLFMAHAYYADIDRLGVGDTALHAAPMSHGSGLYGLATAARGGLNVVLGGFDPTEVLDAIEAHTKVSMFAAPTMVTRLMAEPSVANRDLTNLKTITYGGAPMYVSDLKRALVAFGPRLYQLYGQGESPMTITGLPQEMHIDDGNPHHEARLGSTGVARTGVAVRILRADGSAAEPDEVGEIVTRSDCLMSGYWQNPEATARTIRDGWLWTGDLGTRDVGGFLTLKDRSKDMIISGGSNIYPREIEEVLLTHPGVHECAVIGRPHPDWGEEVVAFVVARPGGATPTADALDALCLDNIARFKRPKRYRFVDELPKNNYGKILKTELRLQD